MKKLLQEQWAKLKKEKGWPAGHWLLPFYLLLRLIVLSWRWLRATYSLRKAQNKGRLVFQNGFLNVQQEGQLLVGNRVRFWSTIATTHLRVGAKASLEISDNCYINGALIAAHNKIHIGRGVYLAPMTQLMDSYAFGTPEADQQTAPITIEENAWLATRAVVLPGVTVGRGAVVGVGALVTENVPPRAIVAGVPARIIRYLDKEESPTAVEQIGTVKETKHGT